MQMRSVALSGTVMLELLLLCCVIIFVIVELPSISKPVASDSGGASAALNNQIMKLAVTANGQELWLQKGLSDVIALDVKTHQLKTIFTNRDGPVGDWSVSRDGSIAVLAKDGRDILIYRKQEVVAEETLTGNEPLLADVSSNGCAAVRILDGKSARCWDLSKPEPSAFDLELVDRVVRLGVDSLARFFVTSNVECAVQVYDLRSGLCIRSISCDGPYTPSPSFSGDGRWFALNYNKSIAIYRAADLEKVWSLSTTEFEGYRSVAFSPDGKWVALSFMNAGTQIFDTTTGERQYEIQAVIGVPRICFSADSDRLYFGTFDGSVFQWSLSDHKLQQLITRSAPLNSTGNSFPRGGTP